jgi:hypothetical protein
MIKVRFNLGRGVNYKKWKISYDNGEHKYFAPEDITLVMEGCTLINKKKTAEKIYKGAMKSVCAWVECKSLIIYPKREVDVAVIWDEEVSYNPRVKPNWVYNTEDVDGREFDMLYSIGKKIYYVD